jgi:hypothetical protein
MALSKRVRIFPNDGSILLAVIGLVDGKADGTTRGTEVGKCCYFVNLELCKRPVEIFESS